MISYERQNEILELLKERRTVTVEFLCRRLFASGATVRRDLAEMAQKGLLERVRGGATLISGASQDAPLLVRTQKDREKKKIAAGLALDFLEDNMTVMLDSSSTVTCLAAQLARFKNLSVVTNGIETAGVLNENTSFKIYLCGGLIQNNSSMVGSLAQETLEHFHTDILFFSCCGISAPDLVTEANEETAAMKKLMLRNAKKKILLCDSTKMNREYFCKSCRAQEIYAIVTDAPPDQALLASLKKQTQVIYPQSGH